jgi:hypothetical protein
MTPTPISIDSLNRLLPLGKRDGMKSIRELGLTLTSQRWFGCGRDYPIARLESRMKYPRNRQAYFWREP